MFLEKSQVKEQHTQSQEPGRFRDRQVVLWGWNYRRQEDEVGFPTFPVWVTRWNYQYRETLREEGWVMRKGRKKMYPNLDDLILEDWQKHHMGICSKQLGIWSRLDYFDSSNLSAKPNVLPITIWICTTEYFRDNSLQNRKNHLTGYFSTPRVEYLFF